MEPISLAVQSTIVYGILIWTMTHCGLIAYKQQYPNGFYGSDSLKNQSVGIGVLFTKSYFVIPIFIFCLFASLRYQVGVDCNSYKDIFYELGRFGRSLRAENIEGGFILLSKGVYDITGTHYLLFFLLALLQIVLYYFAFIKERYVLIYLGVAIMLTGHYWSLMNGMRQNIAACALVALIPLIVNRKWMHLVIITLLATTMHRSALLILPIGVLVFFTKNKVPNKYLQFVILAISFIAMNKFDHFASDELMEFADEAGYTSDEIAIYADKENTSYNFGLRMMLLYTVYLLVIMYSEKMSKAFNSVVFNAMYNLFFIGICATLIFYNNPTMIRVLYYFTAFVPPVISYFLFYISKIAKIRWAFYVVIAFLLVQTIWGVYTDVRDNKQRETSLYKFDVSQDE